MVSESPARISLGLERIVHFLERILPEDPRAKLRVVHVAGTNGKGSVCALVAEGAIAAGYKVGIFNSPHFLEPNDAIRVQGQPISATEYAELRAWIASLDTEAESPAGPLSLFEQATVAAIWWFAKHDVDLAVIEVGMGGLRDATNVFGLADGQSSPLGVGRSLVQCICPVDEDHLGIIGDTIEDIAREKSGIMRPGSWIVIGNQERTNAFHVIHQHALLNSPQQIVNIRRQPCSDISVPTLSDKLDNGSSPSPIIRPSATMPTWATYNSGRRCLHVKYPPLFDTYTKIPPPTLDTAPSSNAGIARPRKELYLPLVLPGIYQSENASVAFYALDILRTYYGYDKLTDAAIQNGFQNVIWPGRLSWLRLDHPSSPTGGDDSNAAVSGRSSASSPRSGKFAHFIDLSCYGEIEKLDEWILADGAHNEPAAAELRKYVDTTLRRFTHQRYIHPRNTRPHRYTPPVRWIVGFSQGKAMTAILNHLALSNDLLWLVPFSKPSEMPWIKCETTDAIYSAAQKMTNFEQIKIEQFDSLASVLDRLAADKSDTYMNVLCGSLYLVADLYRELKIRPFDVLTS
ncbi:folylpolyglutamate synthase [Coemansia aciculifera]|uniref:Folylpolyglutamate synthase n=1 Tax=Coemansia aciculifera TaxID=417176 RepID=A0A9W8IPD8_9FUNG|nr:folylpolyglutamate synthase [Coemansia aciculifera]